jgi:hypothetical protein
MDFFEIGSDELFAQAGFEPVSSDLCLLITGVSHHCPATWSTNFFKFQLGRKDTVNKTKVLGQSHSAYSFAYGKNICNCPMNSPPCL